MAELLRFLKSLLNALLHLEGNKQIKTLTHMNPFSIVDSYTEKEIIFDIKVELDNGDQVDIEMQVQANNAYRKRSLYYWAKLHSEQSLKGQDYEQVVKSICINIVDAKCLRESKKAHNFFQVIDCNEHFLLCDDLEIHYFQLPNMYDIMNIPEEITDEEGWLLLIRNAGKVDEELIRSLVEKKEVLKMTYEAYNTINSDSKYKYMLEAREKYTRDKITNENIARREGLQQGIEQGIQQGIEKAKVEIVQELLKSGSSIDFIVNITKLEKDVIERIGQSLQE